MTLFHFKTQHTDLCPTLLSWPFFYSLGNQQPHDSLPYLNEQLESIQSMLRQIMTPKSEIATNSHPVTNNSSNAGNHRHECWTLVITQKHLILGQNDLLVLFVMKKRIFFRDLEMTLR